MAHPIPPLNALRAFEVTARLGTLAKAADELCVTPSAVGHQVKNLEDWLGIRLFQVEGGARRLTFEGERLAQQLGDAFGQINLACRALSRNQASTELHIHVTPTFAIRWLVPRLGRFQALHPDISVHIATSARPIDFERDDVYAAIQFGGGTWPGMIADLLFKEDVFPVCHPRLLEGDRPLVDPHDLRGHTLLHTYHRGGDWARWLAAAGVPASAVDPDQGQTFDLTTMALDAAEAGMGIAITREAQVRDALEAGRLAAPFRRDLLRGEGCYFVSRKTRRDESPVKAFRDWLLAEAAAGR
jgi:LysR family glycine cleavage system transcriptional activator|tara:strand:+ start:47965 stop:48864 length:900 start_codon:yes stop_codon:yes gene_type:complete